MLKGFGMGLAGLSAGHETGFGTTGLTPRFTPATPSSRVDRWMLWEAAPRPGFVAALVVDVGAPAASGSLPAPPGHTVNWRGRPLATRVPARSSRIARTRPGMPDEIERAGSPTPWNWSSSA